MFQLLNQHTATISDRSTFRKYVGRSYRNRELGMPEERDDQEDELTFHMEGLPGRSFVLNMSVNSPARWSRVLGSY